MVKNNHVGLNALDSMQECQVNVIEGTDMSAEHHTENLYILRRDEKNMADRLGISLSRRVRRLLEETVVEGAEERLWMIIDDVARWLELREVYKKIQSSTGEKVMKDTQLWANKRVQMNPSSMSNDGSIWSLRSI